MSNTYHDAPGKAHREAALARRHERRQALCTHGLPRLECDACLALATWQGARFQTIAECLEVEAAVTSLPLPLGSALPAWSGKNGDF